MSSKSIPRIVAIVATLLLFLGNAYAGRKRVCVLDFEGPKAEKFHEDLVKLLKKQNHTVVSVDKWNAKAEELDAGKVTEKNVKKVAKKLKVDGVVIGKIEKRRDEYIIRLKLRSGTTGELVGNPMQTKADGPRLDGQAQRDIKDELVGAIDELESNHSGGDDEEDGGDVPKSTSNDDGGSDEGSHKSGFSKKHDMDDESSKDDKADKKDDKKHKDDDEKADKKDDKKHKDDEKADKADKKDDKKHKDDDEKVAKDDKKDDKKDDEKKDEGGEGGEGEESSSRSKKHEGHHKKKTAEEGEGEGEGEGVEGSSDVEDVDAALKVAPSRRAIDAVVGLSFTARNLAFKYSSDLGKPPPGYKQGIPVGGALVDIAAFPMSFNHKPKGIISGIGIDILYDQALFISSKKKFADAMGNQQTATLATKESRFAVGGILRYPLGTQANSIVVGGTLHYSKQTFTVDQKLPNMDPTDIPNVAYSMIAPGAFIQAPVLPKITLNANAKFLLVTNTGDIQSQAQYGPATVTGFEFMVGADYMLLKNVFVRAAFRYQTIGFKFKGDPMSQTNTRDTDPDQDVQGARDTYMGGAATVGYVY